MKVYCVECGSPVPWFDKGDGWKPGRCAEHPKAKRMSGDYIAKRFADMRAALLHVEKHEGKLNAFAR